VRIVVRATLLSLSCYKTKIYIYNAMEGAPVRAGYNEVSIVTWRERSLAMMNSSAIILILSTSA
jgi:hypothetical protein